MKLPKIPSLFKNSEIKSFDFKPRYYNKKSTYKAKSKIKFKRDNYLRINNNIEKKSSNYKILLLIIILSLLSYKILIN